MASHAQFDLYLKGNALAGLRLFDTERPQIDAGWAWALAHTGIPDADTLLLDYPNALYAMADLRYDPRRERIPQLEAALAAARRLERKDAEGVFLGNLGNAYADVGDARQALTFHEQWLAIAQEIGDRRGEGNASWNLGLALEQQGELARAVEAMQVCVDFEREIGHPDAEANAARLEQLRQRLAGGEPAGGRRRSWWQRLTGRG